MNETQRNECPNDWLVMRRLAKVGDTVICRCKYPVPYTIMMILNTEKAAAEVNEDLLSDAPMWELVGA